MARIVSLQTGYAPKQTFHSLPFKNRIPRVAINKPVTPSASCQRVQLHDISHDVHITRNISHLQEHLDMADEQRFVSIETEVSALKEDVSTINTKLDKVLEALAKSASSPATPAPTSGASSTAPQNAQSGTSQQNSTHQQTNSQAQNGLAVGTPSAQENNHNYNIPQGLSRQMAMEDFIQREMERDQFEYPQSGRYAYTNDFNSARVLAKPYMYMYRDGLFTIKQKLDARQSMTALEYIDAMLALMADPKAYDRAFLHDMSHHLRKVTRDALERPWPAVRRWTHFVWDSIESGAFTWADRAAIQDERVRICLTGTASVNTASSNQNSSTRRAAGAQDAICRAYNSRSGCSYRENHMEGYIYNLHICTYCDSLGKACVHSVRECERRLNHTRNDNGSYPQNRNRGSYGNGQQHQYGGAPYTHHYSGFAQHQNTNHLQPNSKNGY